MIKRERSATANGGLGNGFVEWVRRSGGFVGVGLRNGFSGFRVEFEQEKMEGMTR